MSEESGKGGASKDELFILAKAIDSLPGIVLRGLMTIPENTKDTEKQKNICIKHFEINTLCNTVYFVFYFV